MSVSIGSCRMESRHALCETEQLLATLPAILVGLSPDLMITRWNRMAEKAFGLAADQVCGGAFEAVPIRWNWERIREGVERCRTDVDSVRIDDLELILPSGMERILGLTIHSIRGVANLVLGFSIIGADITERKALEQQLAQAQKMRSIGQLASGIAHEINTPTQYVGDNIRFLSDAFEDICGVLCGCSGLLKAARAGDVSAELVGRLEADFERAELDYLVSEIPIAIQHCREGVDRISRIVRAMKEFAHPGLKEKVPIDLNRIIETTITVARNEWKYVADLKTAFDVTLPQVVCHPPEINQVVLNMIINAAQAIEDMVKQGLTAKGQITVATSHCDGWAEIRISDTGCGIPEEIRPRIFDPFFTTKEMGRGSGQGLAICYPVIVERHNGRISFESEMGKGTTFTIGMPLQGQDIES